MFYTFVLIKKITCDLPTSDLSSFTTSFINVDEALASERKENITYW